jgi:polyisoprenoid-binding protein YceI
MRNRVLPVALALTLCGALLARARADDFAIDPYHSSISFQISHLGLTYVHGRFNEFSGDFNLDKADAAKSSFNLTIKTASVDTNNAKRDAHLRSPDFFDVKQNPTMTFKSTAVKAAGEGYRVTGNLTLNGVTRPLTFTLEGGKAAEFPKGTVRIGFHTHFTLKRSDFEMKKMVGPLGDEVKVYVGFEGVKK